MKRLVFLFLVVTSSVVLVWVVSNRRKSGNEEMPAQPPTLHSTNTQMAAPVAVVPSIVPKTNEFVRPLTIPEDQWAKLMQLRLNLLNRNQPVEFYGRVVDQHAQPVEGAKLALKLFRVDEEMFETTNFLGKKLGDEVISKQFELVSDAQGWVELKGVTGSSLYVLELSKAGHSWTLAKNMGTLLYKPDGKRSTTVSLDMEAAFNPAKGYTFHLWKKGETERLVRWQSGFGLLRPTTNILLNLVSGRVVTTAGDADLEAQVEYLFPDDPDKAADRRIHLRGLHGLTLVETGDPYPYSAAETGYVSAVHYDTLPSQGYGPGGTWNWQKNFYVLARSGRIRGAVRLDFNSGEMNFGISGYVNPTGSRNLEPDPEKQITDREEIRRLDEATRVK